MIQTTAVPVASRKTRYWKHVQEEGEMDILFGILLVLLLAALIAYSVRD